MKKIYNIFIVLFTIIYLSSGCSDYLDKVPEGSVPAQKVDYSKTEDMFMPVSGLYAMSNKNFSFWAAYGLLSVRGDDVDKGSSENDQAEFNYAKEFNYSAIKSYWALNSTWENLYNVVLTANDALTSLHLYSQHLKTEDQHKLNKQYAAEVRFLRAYAFFRISNLWGHVPLSLNNNEITNPKEKVNVNDVRKFIVSELDFCTTNLPEIRPNEQNMKGAITKYTAQALKAKVYLYLKEFVKTKELTDSIINSGKFQLYSDYYQLFKIPGKLSNESLYELQFSDFGNGSGEIVRSDAWFAFQGPRGNPAPVEGWGFMVPSKKLVDLFESKGEKVRLQTTILYAGKETPSGDIIKSDPDNPAYYAGKAYTPANQMTPGRTSYGDNNNIRIIRYADVLLMNAEAKVRLGENGDIPLNLVRTRAGMPTLNGATVDDILEERRIELAMEWGERFFDLVRTDKASTVLPNFVKGEHEFYPIPLNQEDLNPNLKK